MDRRDSLAIDIARWDLDHEASKCSKGYVVRSRLKRVPRKAMKCNMLVHEEEVWRFLFQHIKLLDAWCLWVHFCDHFACHPDHLVQDFHSYLSDFIHLQEGEAASCKGVVTECSLWFVEAHWPQQIARTRWFIQRSLLEAATHVCLTGMFNHWFAQGWLPGSINKGMITLLKKGDRHIWRDLNNYKPITLLNLASHLQLIISDLIGPEQYHVVKGRSIQNNLHLVHKFLEGSKDGTEATLINLYQSKAFNRVDHQFLVIVLETTGFNLEFCKWISMMYYNPQAVVQVNGKHSEDFAIVQLAWQGCSISPFLYVLALEPLHCRLRGWEGKSSPEQYSFCWPSFSKSVHVH